jgi:hypothetical protein
MGAMYQDQQSIKVFGRQHARDQLAVPAHDRAEALEWRPISVLGIIVIAVLIGIVLGAA